MIIEVAIENIDGDDDGNRLKCDLPNADTSIVQKQNLSSKTPKNGP
jgi:hypothetical protein